MSHRILAINPGSTSTKVALYEDTQEVFKDSINYNEKDLEPFHTHFDEYEMRAKDLADLLKAKNVNLKELSATAGRGGLIPPARSGAQLINDAMIDRLKNRPLSDHACNLGAPLALSIARPLGIPAYIYDPVVVDEIEEIARFSGLPEIPRIPVSHVLNARATAIKVAKQEGKHFADVTYILTHLGGGQSTSLFHKGRQIDLSEDDGGSFAPERAGQLPTIALVDMCYKTDRAVMMKKMRGIGGIYAYLGTKDLREVEKRISEGNAYAKQILEAQAYQTAKDIGKLATVVYGKVDKIILTGTAAHSKMLTDWITSRVTWIAPVQVEPGENELEALAHGVLRVLTGEEQASIYE